MFALRDPEEFCDRQVMVGAGALALLEMLDGEHTVAEITNIIREDVKHDLPAGLVERFIRQLDEALLLDSPQFQAHRAKVLEAYRQAGVRSPAHAGASYPEDPAALRAVLDSHFDKPHGPGRERTTAPSVPTGLVIPHIDLRCGGPAYAWAYSELSGATNVDTFVILGVAHSGSQNRYTATRADFQTPLGSVKTDRDFLDTLAGKLPFDLYADELAHRREHSVEFQAVYLQHLFGGKRPFQIVPVLVGAFDDLMMEEKQPIKDEQVMSFVIALRRTIAESGKRACVLASVDLAHVGGKFGDPFTVNEGVRAQIEAEDREMLEMVAAGNMVALAQHIYKDDNRRRVDAFPAVYTMLCALEGPKGKLLHYAQTLEEETNSVVSYASMRVG
jgi:AmmeMemoRadiSam system protein B